jgi:hypothetical protein
MSSERSQGQKDITTPWSYSFVEATKIYLIEVEWSLETGWGGDGMERG